MVENIIKTIEPASDHIGAESLEHVIKLITNVPSTSDNVSGYITNVPSTLDKIIEICNGERPISEIITEPMYSIRQALGNFNYEHGIHGIQVADWFGLSGEIGYKIETVIVYGEIAVGALLLYYVAKKIQDYRATGNDQYFMKRIQRNYQKKVKRALKQRNRELIQDPRSEKKRFPKFSKKMNMLFSYCSGYAARSIIFNVIETKTPYDTLNNIVKELQQMGRQERLFLGEVIPIVLKHIPNYEPRDYDLMSPSTYARIENVKQTLRARFRLKSVK